MILVRRYNDKCVERRFDEAPVPQAPKIRLPARGPKILDMILLIKVLLIFNMIIFVSSQMIPNDY